MTKGLLLLIGTGFSWVLTGAIVGLIARRGYRTVVYQLTLCVLGLITTATIACLNPDTVLPPAGIPFKTWFWVSLGCFVNGFFNYFVILFMSEGMKRGPNSLVWAIIQSGLIYPFLMGTFVFHVPMPFTRALGILLIIVSIFLYAVREGKSATTSPNKNTSKSWFIFALLGMLSSGINQSGGNLPSFLNQGQEFSAFYRSVCSYIGLLTATFGHILLNGARGNWFKLRPGELKTVATITSIAFVIGYAVSVTLFYPGLDCLENLGRGSMGFPIIVCSCIIGFFPYGLLVLREKLRPLQLIGACIGVLGILLGIL